MHQSDLRCYVRNHPDSTLKRTDDDAINAAWPQKHPGTTLIAADPGDNAAGSRDDVFPLWLNDRSQAAADFVKQHLLHHDVIANTYNPQNPAAARRTVTLRTRAWRRSMPRPARRVTSGSR